MRAGESAPEVRDPAATEAADHPRAGGPGKRAQRHTLTSRGAAAITATLALALLTTVLAYSLRSALTEADRTAAVGSARTTLETVLSYASTDFDTHVAEVLPLLTNPFKDEFGQVARTDIGPLAVENDATVLAKVHEAGVMDATGDGGAGSVVRVMAFVNQATTSTAQQTPAIDQNRVIATMTKVGDRWLLSGLEAY